MRRSVMDNLTFSAEVLHRHRALEMQETARIERFLQEIKKRDANNWQQRRLQRNRRFRY